MSEFLTTALKAIDKASKITKKYYQSSLQIEIKADKTPVTIADKEAEQIIIETIHKDFPNHSFYGEESGTTKNDEEFLWIIDPIDGTKNFIGGIPLWGTLLALKQNDETILGISHIPGMNEILHAEKNNGAFLNNRQVNVSGIDTVGQAMLSFGSFKPFQEKGYEKGLMKLIADTKRQRSFGDLYPYHLLASGRLEIVCEAAIKIVDVAPFEIIIKEAGGKTSDFQGNNISMAVTTFLAANAEIHTSVLNNYFLS